MHVTRCYENFCVNVLNRPYILQNISIYLQLLALFGFMDKNADTYVFLNLISDPRCFLHREIVEVLLKNNNDRIAVHEYVLSELGLQKNCPIFFP